MFVTDTVLPDTVSAGRKMTNQDRPVVGSAVSDHLVGDKQTLTWYVCVFHFQKLVSMDMYVLHRSIWCTNALAYFNEIQLVKLHDPGFDELSSWQ